MTREAYEAACRTQGFGLAEEISFAPLSRSALHVHDQTSFVYVLRGQFILSTRDRAVQYDPGQTCMLAKNIAHAEEAGEVGAVILVAQK